MKCYGCDIAISGYHHALYILHADNKEYGVCTDCRLNPLIMLDGWNIHLRFKLKVDEVTAAKLIFHVDSDNIHFFIKDVIQLAEKLTKDLPEDDPKRIAYLSQINAQKAIELKKATVIDTLKRYNY